MYQLVYDYSALKSGLLLLPITLTQSKCSARPAGTQMLTLPSPVQYHIRSRGQLVRPIQGMRLIPMDVRESENKVSDMRELGEHPHWMGGLVHWAWTFFDHERFDRSRQADRLRNSNWIRSGKHAAAVSIHGFHHRIMTELLLRCRSLIAIQSGVDRQDMAVVTSSRK